MVADVDIGESAVHILNQGHIFFIAVINFKVIQVFPLQDDISKNGSRIQGSNCNYVVHFPASGKQHQGKHKGGDGENKCEAFVKCSEHQRKNKDGKRYRKKKCDLKIAQVSNIDFPEMNNEHGCITDVGEVSFVKTASEGKIIVRGKKHGDSKAAQQNSYVMKNDFKYKAQHCNGHRCKNTQRPEVAQRFDFYFLFKI